MKRIVLPLALVIVASVTAAFFILKHQNARHVQAAQLVPPDSLFFAELHDCPRTAQRWRQTALFQLWQEPEVQAFMEKPRAKLPLLSDWQARLDGFSRIQPRQAFIAVTSLEGDSPRWVAGFSFSGSRGDVDRLLADPRAQLRKAWPAGKADIATYGTSEIQTYTEKNHSLAETFRDNWYFASNQLDLLHATLDRYEGKAGGPKGDLAADETYQKSIAPLPKDGDLTIFGRIGVLTDRLAALMAAAGQKTDNQQLADLKKTQAIAMETKVDGAQFRDTIYAYAPGGGTQSPLSRRGLALSTASTVLYYAATLPVSLGVPETDEPALAQVLPAFADLQKSLADNGLKFSDAAKAFGPEFSSLFDWTPATLTPPSFLIVIDVRDAAKAKAFIGALTASPANTPGWTHMEDDGMTIFQPPPPDQKFGFSLPSPSLALSDRFLVLGLTTDAVTNGMAQLKNKAGKLGDQPAFQAAEKSVEPPTSAFGYVDLRSLIERSYGVFRPFLAMSLAFNADTGQYIDAGKLPNTDTLTKHLSPSVLSQASTPDGTLIESTGPLTFNQIVVAALAGVGAAALPTIEQNLQNGGGLLPPNLLQSMPGAPSALPSPSAGPIPSLGAPQQQAHSVTPPSPPLEAGKPASAGVPAGL